MMMALLREVEDKIEVENEELHHLVEHSGPLRLFGPDPVEIEPKNDRQVPNTLEDFVD